jgi:hypothetical protein
MIAPTLQRISVAFFFAAALVVAGAELQPGSSARLAFRDVDGNEHFTAKGNVTIVTVVTRQLEDKAQAVADHVPDRCLGNPKYRYLTVVNFQRKIPGPLQGLTKAIIRKRLTSEAERLRPDYAARHVGHDPRQDIFVVPDFDGSAISQLGLSPDSDKLSVFVFNGRGKLVARWNDVPSEEALTKAISAAE